MQISELVPFARIPLALNAKPGDEVLILVDEATEEAIPKALVAAAREIGAEASTMIVPAMSGLNKELSRAAAGAMRSVELLLTTLPSLHTQAARSALAAGIKYVSMFGMTVDCLAYGAGTADPDELLSVTERLASLVSRARSARVISDRGTDVAMDLTGRTALAMSGVCPPIGNRVASFPSGETPIAPLEGSVEGTIVFDTTVKTLGRLSEPVLLRVEKGRVVGIEGGKQAGMLRDLLGTEGDEGSYMIGEFAIGTNPKARITGIVGEDMKARGTVHFGLGDNASLGGNIRSRTHLDGVILRPTVILDGKIVVENGRLAI